MSIDDVKATIRAGNHAVEQGKATFRAAVIAAAEAEGLARQTLHDSRDDEAQEALAALKNAAAEVNQTVRRFGNAIDHADAYMKALG
ncbi:hypothetical protein ACWDV4_05670 [Micromonospora sp. NPDC003197]